MSHWSSEHPALPVDFDPLDVVQIDEGFRVTTVHLCFYRDVVGNFGREQIGVERANSSFRELLPHRLRLILILGSQLHQVVLRVGRQVRGLVEDVSANEPRVLRDVEFDLVGQCMTYMGE